jgi:hypothetical protein
VPDREATTTIAAGTHSKSSSCLGGGFTSPRRRCREQSASSKLTSESSCSTGHPGTSLSPRPAARCSVALLYEPFDQDGLPSNYVWPDDDAEFYFKRSAAVSREDAV